MYQSEYPDVPYVFTQGAVIQSNNRNLDIELDLDHYFFHDLIHTWEGG